MKVLEPPLDAISRQARPYPAWVLPEGGTGLCLFAAAFLGHNDAIHMARADMEVTCVDVDSDKLDEMCLMYPRVWCFVEEDVWGYAVEAWGGGYEWDVVSLDPFTNLFDRVAADIELWCSLARKTVVMGCAGHTNIDPPDGWRITNKVHRAANVYWAVLEREAA